jgi:hypothetical protein
VGGVSLWLCARARVVKVVVEVGLEREGVHSPLDDNSGRLLVNACSGRHVGVCACRAAREQSRMERRRGGGHGEWSWERQSPR